MQVSTESLTREERAVVDEAVVVAAAQGVLVGALRTGRNWDVRPLLLDQGSVSVIRLSHPAAAPQSLALLERTMRELSSQGDFEPLIGVGVHRARVWTRRLFLSETLASGRAGAALSHDALTVARRLIESVDRLHRRGVVHGHIVPTNVAIVENAPLLFDHGYFWCDKERWESEHKLPQDFSPDGVPVPATDVYGLAEVLPLILGAPTAEQRQVIARMLHPEPGARPSLAEVLGIFSLASSYISGERQAVVAVAPVRSGKVLQPHATIAAKAPGPDKIAPREAVATAPVLSRPTLSETSPREEPVSGAPSSETPLAVGAKGKALDLGPALLELLTRYRMQSVIAVCLLGLAVIYFAFSAPRPVELSGEKFAQFQLWWTSNQGSLMQRTAEAAVQDDEEAVAVVLQDAQSGAKRQGIRGTLLRVAFDTRWERTLTAVDKKVLVRLGLAPLVPVSFEGLPPPEKLSPAVSLAIMADLQVTEESPTLAQVPLVNLTRLPEPIGSSFAKLGILGVSSCGDPVARGLAQLLVVAKEGKDLAALKALEAYFSRPNSDGSGELILLLPLLSERKGYEDEVSAALLDRGGPLAQRLLWFETERLAGWEKVPKRLRLALSAGEMGGVTFTSEQLADLLLFPVPIIQNSAKEKLIAATQNVQLQNTIGVLASQENHLSRSQTIALLSALKWEGDRGYSFVSSWFSSTPDPDTVIKILLARGYSESLDPFAIEAPRYLKGKRWHLGLDELKLLSTHHEPVVRALMYTTLDGSNPEEAKILRDMAKVEPNKRMRVRILEKLGEVIPEELKGSGGAGAGEGEEMVKGF